ncbi:hypothetical protein ACFY0F_14520 [Streptomyces sp. NPDC001544]|uniref:hypothetical protein n=1 Tax=Streptomyces sp. NPDC001544 TaxID=3364584 RepID=UPI00369049CD
MSGAPVLSVRPDRIPAGRHLLVAFLPGRTQPHRGATIIRAGRLAGRAPSCVPALLKGSLR